MAKAAARLNSPSKVGSGGLDIAGNVAEHILSLQRSGFTTGKNGSLLLDVAVGCSASNREDEARRGTEGHGSRGNQGKGTRGRKQKGNEQCKQRTINPEQTRNSGIDSYEWK